MSITEIFWLDRQADLPADRQRAWVRAARFHIMVGDAVAGRIDLRLGMTRYLMLYGGNIGYFVAPEWRGRGLAAWAVREVLPLARSEGLTSLWITCNPDNLASRRSAENAGATYIETLPLPPGNDMYKRGDRAKSRFWLPL